GLASDARDVYEEGLYIPIMKLFRGGEPNADLFAIIEGNVRAPHVGLGDIHAQVASNDVGGARLLDFMDDFGLASIESVSDQILDRSETALRDVIRKTPNGRYENETLSDGFLDEDPIRLACAIEIGTEDIAVDFEGTSPESKLGINVVLNYTLAYVTFCLKAALSPEIPNNAGSFRPVQVRAPEGCVLNAQRPAPVAGRHIIGHLVPDALFGALTSVVPDQVPAEGAAGIWITQMRGFDERGQFTLALFSCGGAGARPSKDGLGNTGFPSGVAGIPAEVVETVSPIVMHHREIRPDSGGAGRYRGGVGQAVRLSIRSGSDWIVSSQADRVRFAPQGRQGGRHGERGGFWLSTGEHVDPKIQRRLGPDVEVFLSLPGGGGFGPPEERDAAAVLADVVDGHVSIEAAEREYGVVIRRLKDAAKRIHLPEDYELDTEASERLRAERRRASP
ncbi:MAG: hydantoinase B/oxoprolinase family protein, partial [Gaiellales bacterium]